MAENNEVEDRVDLDDDNYTEEDDDVEEPMEDEGAGEGGEENGEEPQEDARSEDGGKGESPGINRNDFRIGHVEDEENSASIKEDEKEKHAELLDLPPHGSEVFIGGLSRDISEEDLRELCEPFGEIFEVGANLGGKILCANGEIFFIFMLLLFLFITHSFIIWQIRVMKNRDTGEGKGFAFVAFRTKDEAQKSIEELHNKEFKVIAPYVSKTFRQC